MWDATDEREMRAQLQAEIENEIEQMSEQEETMLMFEQGLLLF